jgi:hypothetical protein
MLSQVTQRQRREEAGARVLSLAIARDSQARMLPVGRRASTSLFKKRI